MFCEKCGTKLPDDASFCTNCGASINDGESKTKETVEDNEVQLNVKPTFKLGYMILPYILTYVILFACIALPFIAMDGGAATLGVSVIIFLIMAVIFAISTFFTKKQYANYSYDFYRTKVVYRDSFLNLSEKEVKYKYIREATMRQTIFQRMFNIGTIILFTNAETGVGNGISIVNVENVQEVYKNIKQTIDV